jgi:hypothetical protein
VASSLEYVSSDWVAVQVSAVAVVLSDWVAVRVSAVAVVLPECACRREIAAYHRSAVSSFGEHGCVAWTCHAEGGGRGDHGAAATRVPLARRTDWLLAAFCPHSCSDCAHRKRLIVRGALAGGDRGVVVLMKLVGRTRGLTNRGGRREGLVLRGLRAGTRNVSAGARARWIGCGLRVAGGDVSASCVRCRCR